MSYLYFSYFSFAPAQAKLQVLVDKGLIEWGESNEASDHRWSTHFGALVQYEIEHGKMNNDKEQ